MKAGRCVKKLGERALKEDLCMGSSDTAKSLFFLRVVGGWILAVGSFIVAVAVTVEFFQTYPIVCPPAPVPCANSKVGASKDIANAASWQQQSSGG